MTRAARRGSARRADGLADDNGESVGWILAASEVWVKDSRQ